MKNKDNPDELNTLLHFLYKEAKQEEQNLALRKIQLASNSIVGLTLLFLFISFIIKEFGDIFTNWYSIILLGFFFIAMFAVFFLILTYLILSNKYQRIHYITATILEKKLYEIISEKNEKRKKEIKEDIKKEILYLFPLMRVVNKSKLYKGKRMEKWFIKAVNNQNEEDLKKFLDDKFNNK